MEADVIVVGAGLAGLVAATEAAGRGKKVIVLDQEGPQSLGGQAFWSFGGLFLVDSPEQRRMGIRDSFELAWQDWLGSAGFDRDEDQWPRRWARAYVEFAAGEKRSWLHSMGVRFFPIVGWAERGGWLAGTHGNSVPRFHITWGTGPGLLEPFIRKAKELENQGRLEIRFRHRVTDLWVEGGRVVGVRGERLVETDLPRGMATPRDPVGEFEIKSSAVILASGGIGGNFEKVRKVWPSRLGTPPSRMLSGVPAHVDGSILDAAERIGVKPINSDRMWHYTEGIQNWNPIWPHHGIRILPGPSSLWLDALGRRLPPPLFPGFDSLATLAYLRQTGYDYSWFILNRSIIKREFALSGSEQNPDLTGKSWRMVLGRLGRGPAAPIQAFLDRGADFLQARDLEELVQKMNRLAGEDLLDPKAVRREVELRDLQMMNPFAKDSQVMAIHNARRSRGDRLIRVARPHRLLDPAHGPLIAVRLWILTRKTLGGLPTDLDGRVLKPNGEPFPGLFACGEVAGFGGGGVHGYRSLEGTFLGGCLFSGRQAGRGAS
ncbi:MAG: FAD-binding dehydrogenase [Clostridiales bacterium]|nr:FAD-binding dehydrogenase [Clostridiales bacterium]